jgi:hypothetical protein
MLFAVRADYASFRVISLGERERDRAHGEQQNQVKRASNQMRFNGGINLFFHLVLVLSTGF